MRQLAQMITSTSIVARLGIGWCVCVFCVCPFVSVCKWQVCAACQHDSAMSLVAGRTLVGMERAYMKAIACMHNLLGDKFIFNDLG